VRLIQDVVDRVNQLHRLALSPSARKNLHGREEMLCWRRDVENMRTRLVSVMLLLALSIALPGCTCNEKQLVAQIKDVATVGVEDMKHCQAGEKKACDDALANFQQIQASAQQ
jgi:hypothetical protein